MRTLLAAIAVGITMAGSAAVAQPRPGPGATGPSAAGPWVDVHMHLVAGMTGRGPGSRSDFDSAVENAIREMDQFGIAVALVLPPPQVDDQRPYDHADFAAALRRFGGRFAYLGGGGLLNAMIHRYQDTAKVTESTKREFATAAEKIIDAGAIGFGEMALLHLSATQGHPYEFVPANHPLFLVLADVAARRDVPIDLHMDAVDGETPTPPNFSSPPNPPRLADTIGGLERLLRHNPKARVVWAHGASDPVGPMSPTTIGRLMDAHANLFVSLRIVGAQAPTMKNKVLAAGGIEPAWRELIVRHPDRFVIGTDSFMVAATMRGSGPGTTFAERSTPKLQATLHFLSLLPPELARKLARDNATRIYRLPGR